MAGREDIDSVALVPQRFLAGVRARSLLAYISEKTTQPPLTASPKMTPSRISFHLALRQKLQRPFSAASQVALVVKNPPANAGDTGASRSVPGSGRSPGVGNDAHSSALAWEIAWTGEPYRLPSIRSQRVRHD